MNLNISTISAASIQFFEGAKEQINQLNQKIRDVFGCCFEEESKDDVSSLAQVPIPIQQHILSFLDEEDLKQLLLTSKYWQMKASSYLLSTIISQDRMKTLPTISLPSTVVTDGTDQKNHLLLKKAGSLVSYQKIVEALEIKDLNGYGLCKGTDPWGRLFLAAHYKLRPNEEGLLVIEQAQPRNGFRWEVTYSGKAPLHLLSNWKTNEQIRDYMKNLLLFKTCGMPVCRNYKFTEDSTAGTIRIHSRNQIQVGDS